MLTQIHLPEICDGWISGNTYFVGLVDFHWQGFLQARFGGETPAPPKNQVLPPPPKKKFLLTLFLITLSPPTPRLLPPPQVLQLPPKRWNPAGNPDWHQLCLSAKKMILKLGGIISTDNFSVIWNEVFLYDLGCSPKIRGGVTLSTEGLKSIGEHLDNLVARADSSPIRTPEPF